MSDQSISHEDMLKARQAADPAALTQRERDELSAFIRAGGAGVGTAGDGAVDQRRDLMRQERAIARAYHGGWTWMYAALTFAGLAVWLGFFPMAMMGMFSAPGLFLAFAFSTVAATLGFLASHEAMHGNIFPRGHKYHWVNELTGYLALIPLALGYTVARLTHIDHHTHTNDAALDPDYADGAPNWWMAWIGTVANRQPGAKGYVWRYKKLLADLATPEAERARLEGMVLQLVFMGTLIAMAWTGHAIEAALIWWLPRQIGVSWLHYWLSWAPHHPQEKGRYKNTRIFRTRLGYWLSMGMEFHLIHHLYPGIPTHRTRAAYFAMKDVLRRQGVDVSAH